MRGEAWGEGESKGKCRVVKKCGGDVGECGRGVGRGMGVWEKVYGV